MKKILDKEISTKKEIFSKKWHDVLEEIALFRRESMSNWIWFRGHSNEDYKLDSGLFRTTYKNEKLRLARYLSIENQLIVNFKQQSSTFIREDNIDLQFHMQHHGLKTRLLDWTDSLGTALYFAFEGWDYDKETNACIWLLDPYALHTHLQGITTIETADSIRNIDEEDIEGKIWNLSDIFTNTGAEYTFPMYPSKNNARLLVQNGYFTVQSNRLEDLEVELERGCPEYKEKILKKISLSPDLVECIYEYLTLNGINHFTVYNDVDGLSKYLNKELTENAYDDKLKRIAKFSNFNYIMTNR
ncbi:FRG domain-containing protein [Bacillus thuringiensis]|uniref:FRG domain-containing protein n=1 Tax=Bacillus thuringiensis TaxID=1428 RepID=UPI0021D68F9C|nr:FRG domain-containing protein [Bacillus thuringiensis]MCU7676263.1 FRG domain-containing protein [Bacillus thuringiensis]